jgi:hypothetical protein
MMQNENNVLMMENSSTNADGAGEHNVSMLTEVNESETDHTVVDYSHFSKNELVAVIKELTRETDFRKIDAVLKEVKSCFDEIRSKERSEALERYLADGGTRDDFDYRQPEADIAFDAHYKLLRDKRQQQVRALEEQKSDNLAKKEALLEQLRALVDAEDTEHSFHRFKEIQREWKSVGTVPTAQIKPLWASYSALVDRFYDHRSIYFELKELDRKKNLEAKTELCLRAERLLALPNIYEAVRELNELHHEFKHVGPVPKDDQEPLWQRFKAASDAVYEKRDAHLREQHELQKKNLHEKSLLAEAVQTFAAFQSDRIKEWNQKTKELAELQKKWETVGVLPHNKAKTVNKKFWSAFKTFYANKNSFFKKLDAERNQNLAAKRELIQRANELKDSHDWEKTSTQLKDLQLQWKEIGPVPEKYRDKVFEEFKQACDHFFNQRRGELEKADAAQEQNKLDKLAICAEMEALANAKTATLETLVLLQERYQAIGFVPKNDLNKVRERHEAAVEKLLSSIAGISDEQREQARLKIQLQNLAGNPQADRKIFHKEQNIRKSISKVENDIAVLRNNLEFFGRSKNADQFKADVNEKIRQASAHLAQLKTQLKILKTV